MATVTQYKRKESFRSEVIIGSELDAYLNSLEQGVKLIAIVPLGHSSQDSTWSSSLTSPSTSDDTYRVVTVKVTQEPFEVEVADETEAVPQADGG
jgi:hypothetical protein